MVIGPVGLASGVELFPLWLEAAAAPVVAVTAVHLIRTGRLRLVVVAVVVALAALALLLQIEGVTIGSLLGAAGLSGRALVVGVVTIGVTTLIGTALAVGDGLRPSGLAVLVGAATASMVVRDVSLVSISLDRGDALRDLQLYLLAGERMLAGFPPYQLTPIGELIGDQTLYPYLYPPPFLPFVAAVSTLPWPVVGTISIVILGLASVTALRLVRVRWIWVPIFMLWPPFLEGIWVGNVAVIAAFLLCASVARPAASGLLVLGVLFKPQFAIPVLWLFRERMWRALATGIFLTGAIALATLPFVGIGAWFDWVEGLRAWQASTEALPVLRVFALPRFVSPAAFVAIVVLVVVWGLRARGRDGLRRLGLASVVASPTLYSHGLLSMIPAIVTLETETVLLALGVVVSRIGIWASVAVVMVGLTLAARSSPGERLPSA